MALESRRLDKLEQVIAASSDEPKTIAYALGVARQLITSRTFRDQVSPAAALPSSFPATSQLPCCFACQRCASTVAFCTDNHCARP